MWRIGFDISASWRDVIRLIDANKNQYMGAGPGHWNDPRAGSVEPEGSRLVHWGVYGGQRAQSQRRDGEGREPAVASARTRRRRHEGRHRDDGAPRSTGGDPSAPRSVRVFDEIFE
jgi:hypothetical protein